MAQLDRNVKGEVLMPGRVSDCYLGLRLDPRSQSQPSEVLVVASAALLHPVVPQPDGTVLYELVPGHPDRTPHELVFLAGQRLDRQVGQANRRRLHPTSGRRPGDRFP